MNIKALTIAGSDPTGGAGLQADLKVFLKHGVDGCAVPAVLTVQDRSGVSEVLPLPPAFVRAGIEAALREPGLRAVKVGALGSPEVVEAVAQCLASCALPVVLDPVLEAGAGRPLLAPKHAGLLARELLPRVLVVTPNVPEAEALTGRRIRGPEDLVPVARAVQALGAPWVYLKTGHLDRPEDVIVGPDGSVTRIHAPKLEGPPVHGTGCMLSAVITARLALGTEVALAFRHAWALTRVAMEDAEDPPRRRLDFVGLDPDPA